MSDYAYQRTDDDDDKKRKKKSSKMRRCRKLVETWSLPCLVLLFAIGLLASLIIGSVGLSKALEHDGDYVDPLPGDFNGEGIPEGKRTLLFQSDFTERKFNPDDPTSAFTYFSAPDAYDDGNPIKGGESLSRDGKLRGAGLDSFPFSHTESGTLDHVKDLTFTKEAFEVLPGEVIVYEVRASCKVVGAKNHPYVESGYITDPELDFRLGCCAINFLDFENLMIFDFLITNKGAWGFYERLSDGTATFRAFSSSSKIVARRNVDDYHVFRYVYDKSANTMHFFIDDTLVGESPERMGYAPDAPDDFNVILDLGGPDQEVMPSHFNAGFGTFTLLDMSDPNDNAHTAGLNRLMPSSTYVKPNAWQSTDPTKRLWGQGSVLKVDWMRVFKVKK